MTAALRHRLWIQGEWKSSPQCLKIASPFSGEVVAEADQLSGAQAEAVIAAAVDAFRAFRKTSRHSRSRLCAAIARGIEARRAELVDRMVKEAGKPCAAADIEVTRAVGTFTIAAEEAKSFAGEVVPIDIDAGGRAYEPAVCHWVPRGPVFGICPFNFPLNLVAHKVAPALAAGASIVIKPPPQAPGPATLLAEIFEKAAREVSDSRDAIPLAAFQVVSGSNEAIAPLVSDPRFGVLTFTGSDKVGWLLREKAGNKRVLLELGGNAAVIVNRDADLARAASRCAFGAFSYSGQVCISVQRIYVHRDVEAKFRDLLLTEVRKLRAGDPAEKDVTIGPVIDAKAADRLMSWIDEAKSGGAKVLAGGSRKANLIDATVISGVGAGQKLHTEEAFGPVVLLDAFDTEEEALRRANDSRFGLQAGIFTDSARFIQKAVEELDVGGLIVNDVPTFRADNMPYGGMKESGLGREGVRYTMEEYCDRKTIVSWKG